MTSPANCNRSRDLRMIVRRSEFGEPALTPKELLPEPEKKRAPIDAVYHSGTPTNPGRASELVTFGYFAAALIAVGSVADMCPLQYFFTAAEFRCNRS
jgi:hypothetical protein